MNFDWGELAFSSKKPLKDLKAIFIVAPRTMSFKRLREILGTYLKEGNNVVLGIAKETYVEGLENQGQFRMFSKPRALSLANIINHHIKGVGVYTLDYFQRELPYILDKVPFKKVVLVRGSWRGAFHASPSYHLLAKRQIPWVMESPFTTEREAKTYAGMMTIFEQPWLDERVGKIFHRYQMLSAADEVAEFSFDYTFQTGVTLGKQVEQTRKYEFLLATFNRVVPYQTYAMHWGNAREDNLSPPNDLNHYDTVHAETELVIAAGKQKVDLHGTTMFINLLPCPTCARMLAETDIEEFVYRLDHSEGYAVRMLEAAGKKVRRIV